MPYSIVGLGESTNGNEISVYVTAVTNLLTQEEQELEHEELTFKRTQIEAGDWEEAFEGCETGDEVEFVTTMNMSQFFD